ncbi:MAG: hypothetical protein IPK97_20960 [Ahniella sp.]|nr:hypothetical protein [Ahniella sp.]
MNWFSAALLVSGEDLCPALVTELIGEPCEQQTKGVPLLKGDGSILRVPKFGRWSKAIRPEDTDEWDIGEVIKQLFAGLPETTHVWSKVASLETSRSRSAFR